MEFCPFDYVLLIEYAVEQAAECKDGITHKLPILDPKDRCIFLVKCGNLDRLVLFRGCADPRRPFFFPHPPLLRGQGVPSRM